ncbi:jmjd6 [Symbiodinium natans]|uniref:Jmjd6 protein n=1 Tax=Symbiodinium natans TaxID=878477 RepID=A0A812PGD1_9DINO|nr:jmjd6 [Symbiodinium natans]
MASACSRLSMPRLASTVSSLLGDSNLLKVHPILKAVAGRTAPKKDVAEGMAEAQDVADLLGFSATNCLESCYVQESQALRRAARAALEDLVDLSLELEPMCSPVAPSLEATSNRNVANAAARPAASVATERLVEAMDQLVIRHLECLPCPNPAKALQCAQRALALAQRSQLPHAAGRFLAAVKQILLQYPDAAEEPNMQNPLPCKRRRFGKESPEPRIFEMQGRRAEGTRSCPPTTAEAEASLMFAKVDRLSCLPDDLFEQYSISRRPVVAKCPEGTLPLLDAQQLVDLCQGRQLQLMEYGPGHEVWAKMAQVKDIGDRSLGAVVRGWTEGGQQVLFDHPLETACPELASRIRWPSFLESCDLIGQSPFAGERGQDPFWDHPSLFVQPRGSQCGVHVDGAESQFIQLVLGGRKRWSFWPLHVADQFKLLKRRDKLQLEVRPGCDSEHFRHQIRHDQIFPETLPETWRVDVEVEAGEMILVPGGVPHMVTNLQDCIAVSRNFVDVHHARSCADALRWPLPYHDLADFLEKQSVSEYSLQTDQTPSFVGTEKSPFSWLCMLCAFGVPFVECVARPPSAVQVLPRW